MQAERSPPIEKAKMTGFGSPCGACKFLRRKCARGCVFAPYFCHEQGAAHFSAIHKVFGASNVSKLLAHLPVPDRSEAAVTISYEAQARLQDPIYGCVAHIFTLQQQVVNLQAQLASLKAQASQVLLGGSTYTPTFHEDKPYNKLPPFQQDGHGFQSGDARMTHPFVPTPPNNAMSAGTMFYCDNGLRDSNCIHYPMDYDMYPSANDEHTSFGIDGNSSCAMASLDAQASTKRSAYQDMEDLQSIAFAYLQGA